MTTSGRDRDNGEVSRTVHDGLFKSVFSDPALAAEELRAALPPALVASIDWPTITPMPSDFIDAAFRQRIGDLAYHARFLGSGEVLLWLLEHQSTEDWWMLQRILDTKSVMWWNWRRLHSEARHLPVIVPLVVYNGPRPWRAPTDMHALYALPDELRAALGPHVLSYSLVLDDLCAATDEALRNRRMDAYARLCLFAMARAASRDFLDRIRAWRGELRLAFGAGNAERITSFMLYTYRVHRHTHPDIIHERIAAVAGPEHEDAMLSAYDQIIEKGIEKGIERGIEKGQRATLLRQLGRRFGALPEPIAARVAAASVADLERWLDRVIDAASLDDVFASE
jgi:predicted transposase YdaD